MLATKIYKGITITITNPEAIPQVEERIRKMTAEMIMAKEVKELEEELISCETKE